MYKNIEKQAVLQLKDLVEYQTGQVVSKTLVQNDKVSMTIFSFDKGEEISTHAAGGDAMVTVLEGTGKFTVGGEVFLCNPEKNTICNKAICQSGCRYTTHQQFAQLDNHGKPIQADILPRKE